MSITDIAKRMTAVKAKLDECKRATAEMQKEFDELRKVTLPDAMESAELSKVTVVGVGTISMRTDAYASIKSGMNAEAYQWLEENGHADLVKSYVQPSTMKAFLKEQFTNGEPVPDGIFNFNPYTYATITKR